MSKIGDVRKSLRRSILSVKLVTIAILTLIFSTAVLRTRLSTLVYISPNITHYYYYSYYSTTNNNNSTAGYDGDNDGDDLYNKELRRQGLVGSSSKNNEGFIVFDMIYLSLLTQNRRFERAAQSLGSVEDKVKRLAHDMNINYSSRSNNNNINNNNNNNNTSVALIESDVNIETKKQNDDNNNILRQAMKYMALSFDLTVDHAVDVQVIKNEAHKRSHSKHHHAKNEIERYMRMHNNINNNINNNNNKPHIHMHAETRNDRRKEAIIQAFQHSWNGYKTYAFGYDELEPQTMTGHNWNNQEGKENGFGVTVIDAVTTLHLMGLKDEVNIILDYIRDELSFSVYIDVSVFETTIRILGGLLSIYELTGEKHKFILNKAKEIGDILLMSFNTSTGIPCASINLKGSSYTRLNSGVAGLAEIGTLQLEFRTLSYHTKDPIYDMKVTHITSILDSRAPDDYMCPDGIDGSTGQWTSQHVTLGANGDSFFEYIIKQYVLTNNTEERYANMSRRMITGVSKLLFRSKYNYTYVAEYNSGNFYHKMDHLACFIGGTIALISQELPDLTNSEREDMLRTAGELTETCVQFYKRQKTGLSPENILFDGHNYFESDDRRYLLRPETVESLFYMWRYTKDQKWRDYGWDIFRAIDKYCRVESGGYAGASDVNAVPPELDNLMQSFWLAETMKYIYLLFADDSVLDLRQWVFNTEAHPLRRRARDPMDLWRQYEAEHGHPRWVPPIIPGVVPIETEMMAKIRINNTREAFRVLHSNISMTDVPHPREENNNIIERIDGVIRKSVVYMPLLKPKGTVR